MQATATVTQSAPRRSAPRSRGAWLTSLIQSVLVVVGACVLLYPTTASWFNSLAQTEAANATKAEFGGLSASSLSEALEQADEYNSRLADGENVDDLDYNSILATDTGAMGVISIPKIDTELPIYHGTDDATLALGVGHLEWTSFPVGGTSTHAVLSAHHGLPEAKMFDRLNELVAGDRFTLSVFGRTLAYQVTDIQTVLPDDTSSLAIQPGKDRVTLVTCTPLGLNTHRLLVTAERVPLESSDTAAATVMYGPGFPWWVLGVVGTLGVAVLIFIRGRRNNAKPRRADTGGTR